MAESWVKAQKSSYCGKSGFEQSYVLDPDCHSYGWLSVTDFEENLSVNEKIINDLSPDQKVLIGVMKVLEGNYGEGNARFVFWFDD